MRVRKLAKDLECSPEQVLAVLQKIGHTRYRDVEQQLPDAVIAQVRRHAGELKQGRTWSPPPESGPVRRFESTKSTEDHEVLERALSGVRPLTRAVPPKITVPAKALRATVPHPRVPPASGSTPVVAGGTKEKGAAPSLEAEASADALRVALVQEYAALRATLEEERTELRTERSALRIEREETRAEREQLRRDGEALRAEASRLRVEADTHRLRLEEAEQELARARTALQEAERAALQESQRSPGREDRPLRRLLEERGLRGDDEGGQAVAAILAAHWAREVLDHLVVREPRAFGAFLRDRVLLLGAGEEAPSGLVGVAVSAERSEGPTAVRSAVRRLETILLVHGRRRLAVLGGPGAGLRVLREVLDARIELRTFPWSGGAAPDVPAGMVVVLWGEAADDRALVEAFPEAVRVPAGNVARLCAAVAEAVERG